MDPEPSADPDAVQLPTGEEPVVDDDAVEEDESAIEELATESETSAHEPSGQENQAPDADDGAIQPVSGEGPSLNAGQAPAVGPTPRGPATEGTKSGSGRGPALAKRIGEPHTSGPAAEQAPAGGPADGVELPDTGSEKLSDRLLTSIGLWLLAVAVFVGTLRRRPHAV